MGRVWPGWMAGTAAWVLAATAPPALGQLKEGELAPEIEAAEWLNSEGPVSLAELRGMTVVLFFWVSFHSGGQSMMTGLNVLANSPEFGRDRGVFVIGLTDADRKRTEGVLREERVLFTVGVGSKSHEDYQIREFPWLVVVDPKGRIAKSGSPSADGDELRRALLEVLAKDPPTKTHPAEARECFKQLELAREALRREDYREAASAARRAYERALTGDALKTRCQDFVDLVEAIGRDRMALAEQYLEEENYAEAVRTLRLVAHHFRGADIGRTAEKRLEALARENRQIAAVVDAQRSAGLARGLLAEAREDVRQRRFGPAYEKLQKIVKEHATSEVAGHARGMLSRMEKLPAVMAEVRNYRAAAVCRSLLAQARTLVSAGNYARARELLEQITREYPDTSYAEQARLELADLP